MGFRLFTLLGVGASLTIDAALVACAPPGRASATPPNWIQECTNAIHLGVVANATDAPADFRPTTMNVRYQLGRDWAFEFVCVRVDDRLAFSTANVPEFTQDRPYQLPLALKTGTPHKLEVVFRVRPPSSPVGYLLDAKSSHELVDGEIGAGVDVLLAERAASRPEERLVIKWHTPS
jgi:hypothetical protein